ncbi:MAG TPA: prolyl oligopeptidase family serine peptidase [Gemmataceae bacterium]|nr:prolyl oligopeptidase family serine peptidase [Gemmataceae bacterium]
MIFNPFGVAVAGATFLFCFLPALALADPPQTPSLLPEKALVLPAVTRGGRSPVIIDPVLAQRLDGKIPDVKAGDEVKLPDGATRKWIEITRNAKGGYEHANLPGGYLRLEVESPEEKVMMFHVSGHLFALVNGEPHAGDPYGNGIVHVPVLLHKGKNELLIQSARGRELQPKLEAPEHKVFYLASDYTLPDVLSKQHELYWAAIPVVNATNETVSGLTIDAGTRLPVDSPLPKLPPRTVTKVPIQVSPIENKEENGNFILPIEIIQHGSPVEGRAIILFEGKLEVPIRKPNETHRRTFRSDIDGSVQYYSVVPAAAPKDGEPKVTPGLTLTLHGAAVEAQGQAACFAQKPWTYVVAPTNRRPYGFDWEDWGRLDALEVLRDAEKEFHTDPQHRWLTGHSMGGHGTWHLGVTFPDKFAAIGPSAGWISMFSYAGMRKSEGKDPIAELLARASSPSDTLALVKNTSSDGVYILHGENDDNVPVDQARTMRKVLGDFHSDFAYYERPGVGHWWGNDCVDWKPMFEFFLRHTIPENKAVRRVDFTTASPGVSADCYWARIEAQIKPLAFSHIQIDHDPAKRSFKGKTENVARLSLDVRHLEPGQPLEVELDGQKLSRAPWLENQTRLYLIREKDAWTRIAIPSPALKGPHRYGPFKDAFRNHMMFVYGTHGSAEENAWALAKARFDAETFWYRGNGFIQMVPDTDFDPKKEPDRNVILYGNSTTNSAWKSLLGESPVQIGTGVAKIGEREVKGDNLGCLFIQPRPGSNIASVGVISGTGLKGMRTLDRMPIFVSGIAYPDLFLVDSEMLTSGMKGVRCAGFFGNDWKVESGEFAWREAK